MKTTKKHFKIFVDECKKWKKELGLMNYYITYSHEYLDGADARVDSGNLEDYHANIAFTTESDEYLQIENNIKRIAFHEMCHILMRRYAGIAGHRFITEIEIIEAEHEIIRRLENLMFK